MGTQLFLVLVNKKLTPKCIFLLVFEFGAMAGSIELSRACLEEVERLENVIVKDLDAIPNGHQTVTRSVFSTSSFSTIARDATNAKAKFATTNNEINSFAHGTLSRKQYKTVIKIANKIKTCTISMRSSYCV